MLRDLSGFGMLMGREGKGGQGMVALWRLEFLPFSPS